MYFSFFKKRGPHSSTLAGDLPVTPNGQAMGGLDPLNLEIQELHGMLAIFDLLDANGAPLQQENDFGYGGLLDELD